MKNKNPKRGPGAFVTEAYNLKNDRDMEAFYTKWAEQYDREMLDQLRYCSPRLIAEKMRQHQPNPSAHILDLGCGTGLTALGLAENGYTNLHGIDLSAEMIEVARQRRIYTSLQVGDINQPLEYKDADFAGIISSGTFTHGHVGAAPLVEICRILKPGGVLACTVHKDLWQSMDFDSTFARLTQNHTLEQVSLEMDRYYEGGEVEGWFCVYRKLPKNAGD